MIPERWRYYSRFYQGSFSKLLMIVLITATQSLMLLPIPLLLRFVFDRAIPSKASHSLVWAATGIFALYLFNGAITLWTRQRTLTMTKMAIMNFRMELIHHLYQLSRSYYGKADVGKLHASVVQDTERLDVLSNGLVALLLPSSVASLVMLAILFYLNPFLALVTLLMFPLSYPINRFLRKKVRVSVNIYQRTFEKFSQGILHVLHGMDLARLQSTQSYEQERQFQNVDELRNASRTMSWLQLAHTLVHNWLSVGSSIILLIVGGAAVIAGSMTLGSLLSFYVALGLFASNINSVIAVVPDIISGDESLETLLNIVKSDELNPYSGRQKIRFGGKIRVDSVSFQYSEAPILRNINCSIERGEWVAIVGPNGAGKSTLLSLILGIYRPQQGALYADDCKYDDLDMVHFRTQIGVVTQEPLLFAGTIAENISYGSATATNEEISHAAIQATALDFIRDLPQGYETKIGENGMLLSGSERQKIGIARALLRSPSLLVLDEPSNHLDSKSVMQLMSNLKKLEEKTTVIIISHNPEIAAYADTIFRIEEGHGSSSKQHNVLAPISQWENNV